MPLEVLGSLQYLTTKSSGACQTRGHGTVHMAYISYDKGWDMAHALISCNYSYRSRTTRTVVELVGTEENYPNSTRVGLLSSYLARISM
jgi:hypothetical protein